MAASTDKGITRRTFVEMAGIATGSVLLGLLPGCAADGPAAPSEPESAPEAPASGTGGTPDGGAPSDTPSPDAQEPQPQPETTTEEEASMSESATVAVAYFSVTGNTEAVADKIATACGVAPQSIEPAEPYSAADIDYNSDCRANVEQQDDLSIRPALAEPVPDVAGASTVFLGYPIWWGKVPRVVLTYVESGALSGKTVVSFCTSGSSGIEGSLSELESADASVAWEPGRRFDASVSETTIDEFVASYAE